MTSLPILIDKALRDAGYDLLDFRSDGWAMAQESGTRCTVFVRTELNNVWLAMNDKELANRIGLLEPGAMRPPEENCGIGRVDSANSLYQSLHLLRSMQINTSKGLSAKVEERLAAIPATDRTSEVRQRIGQDVFREALFELWEGRCALSGLSYPPPLLRASHAKPWADAIDAERLDPFNGLLLAVHFDALFDNGLIAFDDQGSAYSSPELSKEIRDSIGLSLDLKLRFVTPGHLAYLRYHRQNVAKFSF